MKIALINHGCAKNLIDSELMAGMLADAGHRVTLDETKADVVLINTCSFIHDAEEESVQSIVKMINEGKKVIVAGCLPQKHKKELEKALPEVKAFLGTSDINKIVEIADKIARDEQIYDVSTNPLYHYPEEAERQQITVGSYSYLKIAEGCDCECGYCIIPKLRGKAVSRPIENIVAEAEKLTKKGVTEIILIAQDTTAYGKDLYGKPSLAKLLTELVKIKDLGRIRIMYTYPTGITDELLEVIKNNEKIFKYIDIPLQHSSPAILKAMKRPANDYRKLIKKIRKAVPEIALRTTFIVGYPNETKEDFEHLKKFVADIKFDRLGVFEYSLEKGTYSYTLPNRVPARVKHSRKNQIMKLQQKISKELNEKLIGKTIECIAEYITDDGLITARTFKDAPEIDGVIYLKTRNDDIDVVPGDIVKAIVTGADNYDLFGEIIA
ncbi:MAG: 30S ribosomal protein S12 methylthiotransferase RimO [Candidatus Gastranaerophilales bacterium]|nr:30S ribosomal protein S12 methylthiotransferase RimO [Candidatus Gastranaerophilales bacterium]